MQLVRILARSFGFGMMCAALSAFAAQGGDGFPLGNYADIIATPTSNTIDCSLTPFGNAAPVVRDLEPMLLTWSPAGKYIDEYSPTLGADPAPLSQVYRAGLATNRTLRKAVSADLNGNGRDEVVELLSDGTDVQLVVYERFPGPTATAFAPWGFAEAAQVDSFSIVAGDLDGSKDRQQEVAVSWVIASGANAGKVHVIVLSGNALGQIAQGTGVTAASFISTAAGLVLPRLAVGDFLAQGRDQLVLAGYDQGNGTLSMDLLEFDNGTHAESITTALPLGNAMRSAHFVSGTLDYFQAGFHGFYYDDGTNSHIQVNGSGVPVIEALQVNGGDLVDTVAAEFVFHVMFYDPVAAKHVLAMRLLNFLTTRNASNVITSIALNDQFSAGLTYADSSIKLGAYPDPAPVFSTRVADVDAIAQKEVITAVTGHDGNNGALFGPLTWTAHKTFVRNTPDFTYQNLGASGGSYVVDFKDASHGTITSWAWDFGDGSGINTEQNPRHFYATSGPHTVTLTTTDVHNFTFGISPQITVSSIKDAAPQSTGLNFPWLYRFDPAPIFSATTDVDYQYPTYAGSRTSLSVAAGDIDRDGLPEVVVAVNNDGLGIDTHLFERTKPNGVIGRFTRSDTVTTGVTNLDMVLSDFDGDSLNAVVSGVTGDCRNLVDTTLFSVTWMPPYFILPQANSSRFANYGVSSKSSSSTENHSESFVSNSFTFSVGVAYEVEVPVVSVKLSEGELKAKLGGEFQTATGETHGTENEFGLDQGFSVGNDAGSDQEGLLVVEQNTSNCYSYTLQTAGGVVVPNSMMRACSGVAGQSSEFSSGAKSWNESGTNAVPDHWVPLQRDWASLALFRTPTSGSDPATPIAFGANHGVDKATDGLFTTDVESTPVSKPYIEIDLGYVRDIQSIRVFPSANDNPDPAKKAALHNGIVQLDTGNPLDFKDNVMGLWGFRLYASKTPFSGTALPSSASVTTLDPAGVSTFVQDAGVEAVYRTWNVWTMNGSDPLQARYVRLQKPGTGSIRVSEIQVFGETHSEPQFYPEAVCDPAVGDGVFLGRVYDSAKSHNYKTIQLRGDMQWTGTVDIDQNTHVLQPTGAYLEDNSTPCVNDALHGVRQGPIWQGISIQGVGGTTDWNLSADTTQTDSYSHSTEWSAHVGAEFETKFGAGVTAVVGGEYEFTGGTSTENQSGTSVSQGFQLGGEIGSFFTTSDAAACAYHPRPYSYVLKEYSDNGFLQNMSMTDYVVRQLAFAPNAWQRSAVPSQCSHNYADDRIFYDGFGPGSEHQ